MRACALCPSAWTHALVHERTYLHVYIRVVHINTCMYLCMYYLLFSFSIYRYCSLTTIFYMFYLIIMLIYLPIYIILRLCIYICLILCSHSDFPWTFLIKQYLYMYYRKITLIYFIKSMHLYHLKRIFSEIFTFFRSFILSYHVVYIVHSIDSGRWLALITNKG